MDVNGLIREVDLCIVLYGSNEGLKVLNKIMRYLKSMVKESEEFPSLDKVYAKQNARPEGQ